MLEALGEAGPSLTGKLHLILLPGQLCDTALWSAQAAGLADIAEIQIADLTLDDTVEAMAARVLLDAPARFAAAGLSLGGYVAFELMRRASERITHLALMNTSARSDNPHQSRRRQNSVRAAREGVFKGVTERLLPTILHPDHVADAAMGQVVLDMAERVGRVAFERQQNAIIRRPDSRTLLPSIACPALVLGGAADRITPQLLQREIAAGIPGARLEIFEVCGHLAPLEQPAAVNRLLRDLLDV